MESTLCTASPAQDSVSLTHIRHVNDVPRAYGVGAIRGHHPVQQPLNVVVEVVRRVTHAKGVHLGSQRAQMDTKGESCCSAATGCGEKAGEGRWGGAVACMVTSGKGRAGKGGFNSWNNI